MTRTKEAYITIYKPNTPEIKVIFDLDRDILVQIAEAIGRPDDSFGYSDTPLMFDCVNSKDHSLNYTGFCNQLNMVEY